MANVLHWYRFVIQSLIVYRIHNVLITYVLKIRFFVRMQKMTPAVIPVHYLQSVPVVKTASIVRQALEYAALKINSVTVHQAMSPILHVLHGMTHLMIQIMNIVGVLQTHQKFPLQTAVKIGDIAHIKSVTTQMNRQGQEAIPQHLFRPCR
jgi:hypothetical protein